jgi:hypothetical protein
MFIMKGIGVGFAIILFMMLVMPPIFWVFDQWSHYWH